MENETVGRVGNFFSGVRFSQASGNIVAALRGTLCHLLPELGTPPVGPGEGWLFLDPNHPVMRDTTAWRVVNGEIVEKPLITLTAKPPTFAGDGLAECVISHDNAYPLTVTVDPGETITLAVGEALTLTSDVPQRFRIQAEDPELRCSPIIVLAV